MKNNAKRKLILCVYSGIVVLLYLVHSIITSFHTRDVVGFATGLCIFIAGFVVFTLQYISERKKTKQQPTKVGGFEMRLKVNQRLKPSL